MAIGNNISIFKILSWFGIILILGLWFGGSLIGITKSVKEGDWTGILSETGGRLFAIDHSLNEETEYLLNSENVSRYDLVFHLIYGTSLLFMLFLVGFLLFRIGNWLMGIKSFSPSTDIILILLITLVFLFLQFLYTYMILGETLVPMTGVLNFIKNLPAILNRMISI